MVGKLGLLHDYAEHLACELINEVLVAGQEPCLIKGGAGPKVGRLMAADP